MNDASAADVMSLTFGWGCPSLAMEAKLTSQLAS
jgi:hypothetical protein